VANLHGILVGGVVVAVHRRLVEGNSTTVHLVRTLPSVISCRPCMTMNFAVAIHRLAVRVAVAI